MLLLNVIIMIGFTSLKIKDTETYCVFIKNRFQSYRVYTNMLAGRFVPILILILNGMSLGINDHNWSTIGDHHGRISLTTPYFDFIFVDLKYRNIFKPSQGLWPKKFSSFVDYRIQKKTEQQSKCILSRSSTLKSTK